MATISYGLPDARRIRIAGAILLGGLIASLVWRMALAPALLGSFDPRDMPLHQRAMLALGLLVSALISASSLATLSRTLGESNARRVILIAGIAAFAAAGLLAVNIVLLLAGIDFLGLFLAFAALTTGSWIAVGAALVRAGTLKWGGLITAILSALAMATLVSGATIIFIMFIATLPMAIGLLCWRPNSIARDAT